MHRAAIIAALLCLSLPSLHAQQADGSELIRHIREADRAYRQKDYAAYLENLEKAGRDVVLPDEVSRLVLKGATLLRALRKWRGVTQVQLAEMTGLAQSYLSELEAQEGKKGTAEAWAKIAQALDVPADWLVGNDG